MEIVWFIILLFTQLHASILALSLIWKFTKFCARDRPSPKFNVFGRSQEASPTFVFNLHVWNLKLEILRVSSMPTPEHACPCLAVLVVPPGGWTINLIKLLHALSDLLQTSRVMRARPWTCLPMSIDAHSANRWMNGTLHLSAFPCFFCCFFLPLFSLCNTASPCHMGSAVAWVSKGPFYVFAAKFFLMFVIHPNELYFCTHINSGWKSYILK